MSQVQNDNTATEIDPTTQRALARVRWLMLIAGATIVIGIGAILGVIGYRVFHAEGSAPVPDVTVALPQGARVISTAIGEGRIAVTVEAGGAVEVRLFDLKTLQSVGRLRLTQSP
jgi:TRAP-type C4-dicarboxylate transport system permease small subunit